VTAEFAVVLPAVILVLAFCLAGMQIAGQQVRLQDVAADAARILGRGEGVAKAQAFVTAALPGARLTAESRNSVVCAFLQNPLALPGGSPMSFTTTASSCALAGGR
jgi:hypothetical protein